MQISGTVWGSSRGNVRRFVGDQGHLCPVLSSHRSYQCVSMMMMCMYGTRAGYNLQSAVELNSSTEYQHMQSLETNNETIIFTYIP